MAVSGLSLSPRLSITFPCRCDNLTGLPFPSKFPVTETVASYLQGLAFHNDASLRYAMIQNRMNEPTDLRPKQQKALRISSSFYIGLHLAAARPANAADEFALSDALSHMGRSS